MLNIVHNADCLPAMRKMNILELFAGSCSFSNIAKELGHEIFTTDIKQFGKIDYVCDIMDFNYNKVPFIPDIIWASPPCTTYSIAAIGRHRDFGKPKSEFAEKSDKMVLKMLQIIKKYNCFYYIENPRGHLRKMSFMRGLNRITVWYCKYGDTSAKPTDIWSNNIYNLFNENGWQPRAECFNNNINCHHDKQPRGYEAKKRTGALGHGTQGKLNSYERSKVPRELCLEIIESTGKEI